MATKNAESIPAATKNDGYVQKWSERGALGIFWLRNVLPAARACTFSTSQLPKVVRMRCSLHILPSNCASRHDGMHFLNISTPKSDPEPRCFGNLTSKCASRHHGVRLLNISSSKNALNMVCVARFDFETRFAPQSHALFQHLNGQNWSGREMLLAFWLPNLLRATMACNFSSLIRPHGCAPVALASLLFDLPEPQNVEKHSASQLFYLFAIFFLLTLSLLALSLLCLLPPLLLHLSMSRKFDF